MTFLNLSTLAVVSGLAGLAGLLFILQQLRVRHVEIAVATTMFWAAAAREAPVRVYRRRFRHILAYLLVLLICALLWIGFADPEVDESSSADYYVLYLDGSAHTSDAEEFAAAKRRLLDDLDGLPLGAREVILGGAHNVKVLAAGENKLIAAQRLGSTIPKPAPSRLDDQLRLMSASSAYPENVNIVIYGRAPIRQSILDQLPSGYNVTRATTYNDESYNAGISSLGSGDAASGIWRRVDVMFAITTSDGSGFDTNDVSIRLNAQLANNEIERVGDNKFVVRDLAANGAILEVQINKADKLSFDNAARLTLPDRPVIRVALGPEVSGAIANLIAVDDGLRLVTEDEDVRVRVAGAETNTDVPVLQLQSMAIQQTAFEIGHTGQYEARSALQTSVAGLGLDLIDSTGLASAVNREIGVRVYAADHRSISVWLELFESRYNFTGSRSFPIFLSRSIRWLANEPPWYPYLAAGRPVQDQGARTSLVAGAGAVFDTLGSEYVPSAAGDVERNGAENLEVSLLSESASALSGGVVLRTANESRADTATSANLITWIILGILLLLAMEWYLYQRGFMP